MNIINDKILRRFSKLVAFSTLILIFIGALIKSHEVGLSVPDWPTSYGYNMFTFPYSQWVGGIFFEHGHRLFATLVGFLTLVQSILLAFSSKPLWLKKLGFFSLFLVITQGLLGGITVIFFLPPIISIAHGILAQTFFVVTILIAYCLSKTFHSYKKIKYSIDLRNGALALGISVYIQLILGALMRHTASGLAIPDFPKMGGQWIPSFSDKMMNNINVMLFELDQDLVTRAQSITHFLHRFGAVIVISVLVYFTIVYKKMMVLDRVSLKNLYLIIGIVIIQSSLGIFTVLSQKSPYIASMHVVTGASLLGATFLFILNTHPNELKNWRS